MTEAMENPHDFVVELGSRGVGPDSKISVEGALAVLLLVTSVDCHLCHHGRNVLDELEVDYREITVDSDEAADLASRGIALAFLPVLTNGDRVLAYGRFSIRRLSKDLGIS